MSRNKTNCLKDLNAALHSAFENNDNVILIGEDLFDPYGGAFKVSAGLSTKYPDRVHSSPISEAAITGIGIGSAMRGQKAIVEIMFGDFITLAFDQIVNHAAKFPYMYGKYLNIPIVIRTPMGGYRGYGPTHSQSLEKYLLGIPGITIVAVNHFFSPGQLLLNSVDANKPVIFIENKILYPMQVGMNSNKLNIKPTDDYFPSAILCNNNKIEKTDVSIISYGGVSKIIEPLMVEMANEEIWIDCMFVTEISNIELTCNLINDLKSENLVFIEEGTEKFNWSSGIIAELAKKNDNKEYQYFSISAMDYIIPASLDAELEVLPSLENLKNQVLEIL